MNYIKFVRSQGKKDVENHETINTINWKNEDSGLQPAKQNLSMKLSECLLNVLHAETRKKL